MGVVSGDCCGMARYQTVMSIGEPGTGTSSCSHPASCAGIFLVVADTALFVINIGNTWSA